MKQMHTYDGYNVPTYVMNGTKQFVTVLVFRGVIFSPLKIRFVLESKLSLRITWFREQVWVMPSHDIL